MSGVSLIYTQFGRTTELRLWINFIGALPVGALGLIDRRHEYELSLMYYDVMSMLVMFVMLFRRRGRE